jgi:5'-nucleotidase
MTNGRLRVLLTNDDGFDAPWMRCLYKEMKTKHEVVIVAPEQEQSGVGHAFTLARPLRYRKLPGDSGLEGFSVSGTPSECVKFGISYLLKPPPDVVVSGLNNGENSGISGYYSGTVAAARESAFWGIPGFAFSVCSGAGMNAAYGEKSRQILEELWGSNKKNAGRTRNRIFFNINFPACAPGKWRGIKITRQSMASYNDRYEIISTENGEEGFFVSGEKCGLELSDEYDSIALMHNYITVTPLSYDATAGEMVAILTETVEKT